MLYVHTYTKRSMHMQNEKKTCVYCKKEYLDKTKRKVGKTCSKKCAKELGVKVRKQKGSYKRTKEQNEKMVATIKKLREQGLALQSPEGREKISKLMKKRWTDENYRKNLKKTYLEKYGVEHHMKTKEHRERQSKLHTGRKVSVETRIKMSQNSRKQTHRFSKCRGGYREDIKIYVRSSWEANYIRYLNFLGIKWKYEPKTFELKEGYSYTPDFILEDGTIIEIKGWMTKKGKFKIEQFKLSYPNLKFKLIQRKEYRKLYKKYAEIIPKWEKIIT